MASRIYRSFTYKEAVFRISCSAFEAIIEEIVKQRGILETYIKSHPEFQTSLVPIHLLPHAPESAVRMSRAAHIVKVGPMAAVAGTMAQLAAEAGIRAGADEVIVENGGDIYVQALEPVTIGLYSGTGGGVDNLAFAVEPGQTPLSICSSSGKMGHSMSMGKCDLAVAVAKDAALADAAATWTGNLVSSPEDVDGALEKASAISGIDGILIIKAGRIGLAGKLPPLVKR